MDSIINEKRMAVALLGGYLLITDFPPFVWSNGTRTITSISFDKPKMLKELMDTVIKLEDENNLLIDIKRYQCDISIMYLCRHERIISVDGVTSKQKAIFEALYQYSLTRSNNG